MFTIGKIYNRQKDLHDIYGGNRQSGISPCANSPYIFLFYSSRGIEHGYEDHWLSDSKFSYTGEGQFGDMELIRGNLAIKNHKEDGRDIYLFKKISSNEYTCDGKFLYESHKFDIGEDTDDNKRKRIIFTLKKM